MEISYEVEVIELDESAALPYGCFFNCYVNCNVDGGNGGII